MARLDWRAISTELLDGLCLLKAHQIEAQKDHSHSAD